MTKTTFSRSEISPLAERMETGRAKLVEAIATCGKISAADAELVAGFYLKEKVAKLSITIGQFTIQHGAFLDEDVIARALAAAKGAKA